MVFRSPFSDVEIPDVGVHEYLFADIDEEDLDRPAFTVASSGESTSYRELLLWSGEIAGALIARGVGAGDVVGVLSPNTPAFAAVFHGILRAGATVTTVNALATAEEIAKQLVDARAVLFYAFAPLADRAAEAAARAGLSDDAVLLLGADDHPGAHPAPSPSGPKADVPVQRATDVPVQPATHVAALPYSSGTSGRPKGVMITHRNLVANVAQVQPLSAMGRDDVVLAVLPFFHIYGMTMFLNVALRSRSSVVTMARFELREFLEHIQRYRVTYLFVVPPMALALARHPLVDAYDLSSLRMIVSSAAPLDRTLGEAVEARLGVPVHQGYGMTELSPVSHCVVIDRGMSLTGERAPVNASGWAVPNTENKLIDPASGAEIPLPLEGLSEAGDLWVRGPNVMAGYLGNPEATADSLDADGFLHTGDLVRVDPTGCVYIVDRLKELIKYKGYQVPPAELEALLLAHPGIADVAVVGVPDVEGEEIPKAFVVLRPGHPLTPDEVMEHVNAQVAPYKRVRQVEFIAAVPKSVTGKILRRELRGAAR
ncbi:AMP-binding protein [Streptomyces sp. NPDC102274]|uniref:AMP-binding protein n=1 Tax=Streptomyces sp. NPDC102274 TaxID=3366151 RepID=UPI0037F3BEF0